MPSCDPLYLSPLQTHFAYNVYPPESSLPSPPPNDVFSPVDMGYSTHSSYYDSYSSPMSSMPSTPCDPQPIYSPTPAPRLVPATFETFEYYSDAAPTYQSSVCLPLDHLAPDYSLNSKLDFAGYERQGLAPFQNGLPPPYAASVPTYAM